MISLVSLGQAKIHLRIDDSAHDPDVQMKIVQASAMLLDYLKISETSPETWPWGSDEVPDKYQSCTLLILGELWINREASTIDALSAGVRALLDRSRDPALA